MDLFIFNLSIFELLMLLCFGIAWPFSIFKGIKSKSNEGKSIIFVYIVFCGYIFGVIHKVLYYFDAVSYMYVFNGTLVFVDILVYHRNKRLQKKEQQKIDFNQNLNVIRARMNR